MSSEPVPTPQPGQDVDPATAASGDGWLTPGVAGIGGASLLADVGHEVPTALLPALLTSTLRAPASALGLIEGVADGLAGVARLAGGTVYSTLAAVCHVHGRVVADPEDPR